MQDRPLSASSGGRPPQTPPQRPLSGIRVLDLTNVLAGPYCSYQLALLGAEVVKVELPGQGDLARHLGSDPDLNEAAIGASFLAQNAGKKSVELDLKAPGDQAVFRDMVGSADVLLENFRAGVLGPPGIRLVRAARAQPAAGLLRHLRLRPDRPDAPRPRLRPGHPGPLRHDGDHRDPGDRAAARRLPGLRHCGRPDGGTVDLRRPCRALRDRQGLLPRRLDA